MIFVVHTCSASDLPASTPCKSAVYVRKEFPQKRHCILPTSFQRDPPRVCRGDRGSILLPVTSRRPVKSVMSTDLLETRQSSNHRETGPQNRFIHGFFWLFLRGKILFSKLMEPCWQYDCYPGLSSRSTSRCRKIYHLSFQVKNLLRSFAFPAQEKSTSSSKSPTALKPPTQKETTVTTTTSSSSSAASVAAVDAIIKFVYDISVICKGSSHGAALAKHFAGDFRDIVDSWVKRWDRSMSINLVLFDDCWKVCCKTFRYFD